MAGGSFLPANMYPVSTGCLPLWSPTHFFQAAGWDGNAIDGVSDASWHFTWVVPDTLPTGTPTIDLQCQASSTSQVIRVELLWVAINKTVIFSTAKTSETAQDITLSGTADTPTITSITLNATTVPAAGQLLLATLTGYGSHVNWTANVNVWVCPYLKWV